MFFLSNKMSKFAVEGERMIPKLSKRNQFLERNHFIIIFSSRKDIGELTQRLERWNFANPDNLSKHLGLGVVFSKLSLCYLCWILNFRIFLVQFVCYRCLNVVLATFFLFLAAFVAQRKFCFERWILSQFVRETTVWLFKSILESQMPIREFVFVRVKLKSETLSVRHTFNKNYNYRWNSINA